MVRTAARPVSVCRRADGGSLRFANRRGAALRVSAVGEVACAMQFERGMKDLVLIGVSVAFFALSWIYARSFDRL
jgi:hypothetical protein